MDIASELSKIVFSGGLKDVPMHPRRHGLRIDIPNLESHPYRQTSQ
jgi:hypothetical protein